MKVSYINCLCMHTLWKLDAIARYLQGNVVLSKSAFKILFLIVFSFWVV